MRRAPTLDRRCWTTDNRDVRAWVVIAIVCVGGTAAARDARRKAGAKSAAAPAPAVAPAEPREPKPKLESYDNDGCMALGSCGTSGREVRKPGERYYEPPPPPVPPTPLTGAEVIDGFRGVERTVQECRLPNARRDPISVHAAIAKDGKVAAVTVKGQLAPPTTACVENAVKGAHFRASSGLAADYVFLYRHFESGAGQPSRDGGVDGNRDAPGQ